MDGDCVRNYDTCPCIKKAIDDVKEKCAIMFQNLGTDSTPEEVAEAKKKERELILSVRDLDPIHVNQMLAKD